MLWIFLLWQTTSAAECAECPAQDVQMMIQVDRRMKSLGLETGLCYFGILPQALNHDQTEIPCAAEMTVVPVGPSNQKDPAGFHEAKLLNPG